MKSRPVFAVSLAIVFAIFAESTVAQMVSKSQGAGAPVVTPGASAAPNLSGATQAGLNFDFSGLSFSSGAALTLPMPTGGSGAGAISYSSSTPSVCTVSGNSVAALTPGVCTIVATKAGTGVYGPTSVAASTTIAPQAQTPLVFDISNLNLAAGAATLPTASGGSGLQAITYTASGACTLNGSTLSAVSTGTCTVTASNPANGLYSVVSRSSSTTISNRNQPTLVISLPSSWNNNVGTATFSGGAGSGAVTWASSNTAVCSVNAQSGQVTRLSPGTCSLTVAKAADSSNFYSAATPTSAVLTVAADSFATSCWVVDYNSTSCGAGRPASKSFIDSSLCSAVAFSTGGSYSIYLTGSDGRYIRNGMGTNQTISGFTSGASWDGNYGLGSSSNFGAIGSTQRVVCVQ